MGDCVGVMVISSIGVGAMVPAMVGAVLLLATGAGAGAAALGAEGAIGAAGVLPSFSWATTTTAHPIKARTTMRANESMLTGDRSSKELNIVKCESVCVVL